MRILLDTNVIISALIRDGKPRAISDLLLSEEHEIILPKALIEEFSKVVADKRISRHVDAAEH